MCTLQVFFLSSLFTLTTLPHFLDAVPFKKKELISPPEHHELGKENKLSFYELGLERGQVTLQAILTGPQKQGSTFHDTKITKLDETIHQQSVRCIAYKKAYASFQEYFRGQKKIFDEYQPLVETDAATTRKNFGVSLQKTIADAYCSAPSHKEAERMIQEKMATLAEQYLLDLAHPKLSQKSAHNTGVTHKINQEKKTTEDSRGAECVQQKNTETPPSQKSPSLRSFLATTAP